MDPFLFTAPGRTPDRCVRSQRRRRQRSDIRAHSPFGCAAMSRAAHRLLGVRAVEDGPEALIALGRRAGRRAGSAAVDGLCADQPVDHRRSAVRNFSRSVAVRGYRSPPTLEGRRERRGLLVGPRVRVVSVATPSAWRRGQRGDVGDPAGMGECSRMRQAVSAAVQWKSRMESTLCRMS